MEASLKLNLASALSLEQCRRLADEALKRGVTLDRLLGMAAVDYVERLEADKTAEPVQSSVHPYGRAGV